MTTWRTEIGVHLDELGLDWSAVIATTLSDAELDEDFDDGYGGEEGVPFTAWTESWVLFPAKYDGSEWVASAPRHPCDIATNHVGGG